jgi:hypothetical protein
MAGGRAVHDVGGLTLEPIDRSEHDVALWEKRTDAMLVLLRQKDHDTGPASPYEVLEEVIRSLLIEKGVLTAQKIAAQVDLMDSRTPALGAKWLPGPGSIPASSGACSRIRAPL